MHIEADMSYVAALLLASIRLGACFLLTPLFSVAQVPVRVRILFLLSLAAMLVASMQLSTVQVPNTLPELFAEALHELIVGAVLAFGLFTAFGAFLFGGRILDFQMGFGVANLIDPATNAQGPLLGTILNVAAVTTFFLLDGHHLVIRGIAYSLAQVPLGQGLSQLRVDAVAAQFGRMFVFGLMLVAPAVFIVLLLDVAMAIAARTMPQVNIFIFGLPLKIFVGTVVLALSLNYLSPLLKKIFASTFQYWEWALSG